MEETKDVDHRHARKVFDKFCITKVYGLNPVYFFVRTRISMASLFKENRSKIRAFKRYRHVIND